MVSFLTRPEIDALLAVPDRETRHGIEPAPERIRKTTWKEFLSQH